MICLFMVGVLILFGAIYAIHLNAVPDEAVKMEMRTFKVLLESAPSKWELSQFYPVYNANDGTVIMGCFNLWGHIRYVLFYWKVVREKRQLQKKELAAKIVADYYTAMQEGSDAEKLP